ncbi:putative aspartyl-tRNA synthetase [Trypanosoma rangeli]|uniref:aspartate--tRNA ligase n=1 Tax=Trypanosoma rangeli TaxID=5698 RepID=A0A3R7KLC9_TRYRA|nr:putative aspartyl-tRNA synthetase [Trypanosoma rangeli]RNF09792.1 putative aspartyl-tRNA synthetase [Trypanosoma rangeli]|eukprot:RNF09792.1 putative aspartyl-tRNA synthetase [Trypanosoma rangeli]
MRRQRWVLLPPRVLRHAATPQPHCRGYTTTAGVNIATILRGTSSSSSSSVSSSAAAVACETMRMRGRVEAARVRGKLAFIHLRQPPFHSIQVVASGTAIVRQVKDLTPESIIDVTGTLVPVERPVTSVSCSNYELHAERVEVVSKAATPLPFPIRDCYTKLDTRLNHRVVDLRTPLMTSVLRVVSAVCQSFRDQLLAREFVEVHTPKMLGAASESGSAVFTLDYFGQPGYLAQSPQLYKQMVLMGDAMRVFEVGPVFRAEKSLTHRHLTEFVGLDAELVIERSYTEVLDVLESTVCGMVDHLQGDCAALMRRAREALAEADAATLAWNEGKEEEAPIVCELSGETLAAFGVSMHDTAEEALLSTDYYHGRVGGDSAQGQGARRPKVLRLAFDDAVRLLLDHGVTDQPLTDFTLLQERRLGELVRQRYGVDVYVVDQFPAAARPFYTLPHPHKAELTCGFDMYLRGEEICSGAQRIHDVTLLLQNMERFGVDAAGVKDYVDAFRYGAWPHGGFGLGLERIALFLVCAKDIRQISLFPRDPKRLTP